MNPDPPFLDGFLLVAGNGPFSPCLAELCSPRGLIPQRTQSTPRNKPLVRLVEHSSVKNQGVKSRSVAGLIEKIAHFRFDLRSCYFFIQFQIVRFSPPPAD